MLTAFPDLARFFVPKESQVFGVCNARQRVVGLLEDVPLHLGAGPVDPKDVVRTTFWVLDNPGYHFILGRQFFAKVRGVVDVGGHTLGATLPSGTHQFPTIP